MDQNKLWTDVNDVLDILFSEKIHELEATELENKRLESSDDELNAENIDESENDSEEYNASDDESNEPYVDESYNEHYKEPNEGLQVGRDGIESVITTFPSPPAIPTQASALPSDNLHAENNLVEDNLHSDEENIEFAIVNDDINNTFFVNNIDLVTKASSSGINNNFSETEDECEESINLLNKWSVCKSKKRKGARVHGGSRGRKCVRVHGNGF